MTLRQQIIEDRIDNVVDQLGVDRNVAFLRFSHALVTGQSLHDFDPTEIVDGGQDKQIDTISISEEDGDRANLYILQVKNTSTFSSNALVGLINGLHWLFQSPRKELDTLGNEALRDKIKDFRATQTDLGPSNIRVFVRYIVNADTSTLSDEYNQEANKLIGEYDNDTFELFDFRTLGSHELVELLKQEERHSRRVDGEFEIKYDANNPSLIKYHAQGLKGLVCSVPGREIARLVDQNADSSIFDLNIRRYLGKRGGVNRDISETCSKNDSSFQFWFLNNGITIVCDSFDPVTDPDNPHIKLKNMQIVNGCQTAMSLAMAYKASKLARDVRVLMRVYETEDADLVNRIVLTTNNQNRITSRDLRANDSVHLDLEKAFLAKGFYYERKPKQFDKMDIDVDRLYTNASVAQWFLAVVLKNPADARGRKYKVWGEYHDKIFSGKTPVEPYLIASLLGRRIVAWLKSSGYQSSGNEFLRLIAKRGWLHIGRITAFKWRGNDTWNVDRDQLAKQLNTLMNDAEQVEANFEPAFDLLSHVITNNEGYSADVDRALKSSALDHDLNKVLYAAQ